MRERVQLLTKGCKCKSGCSTGRCGCRRKGNNCSEGCSCLHCSNLPSCNEFTDDDSEPHDDDNLELSETLTSFLDSLLSEDEVSIAGESEEENIDSDTIILTKVNYCIHCSCFVSILNLLCINNNTISTYTSRQEIVCAVDFTFKVHSTYALML